MDMTPHFPIYMDYGATTPVDPRVVDAMIPWLREHFGNPASRSHAWGWEAEEAVEQARGHVAALIGADPREIVWTSGATESNNLAIKGAAHFYKTRGKHLVTVKTEHKAVLDTMRELERQGFEVTYLDVQEDGMLDMEAFKAALRPDTILASVMFVNNEIGVIQDIPTIGSICREKGIIFHVDAAQATGKVAIDMATLASRRALACAGLEASALELIVYGSCSPDEQVPNSASGVQLALGARGVAARERALGKKLTLVGAVLGGAVLGLLEEDAVVHAVGLALWESEGGEEAGGGSRAWHRRRRVGGGRMGKAAGAGGNDAVGHSGHGLGVEHGRVLR